MDDVTDDGQPTVYFVAEMSRDCICSDVYWSFTNGFSLEHIRVTKNMVGRSSSYTSSVIVHYPIHPIYREVIYYLPYLHGQNPTCAPNETRN